MIVTRKKYNTDIAALKEIITKRNLDIDNIVNESAKAHTTLINKDNKINRLEVELNRLKIENEFKAESVDKLEKKVEELQHIDEINKANAKDLNKEINELIVSTSAEKAHLIREINRMHAMAYQIYMLLFQNKKYPEQINKIQLETALKLMTKKEKKEVVKE